MKTHAQAVVIGGGLIGCSILYHLTQLGWRDVVLCERDELTSGSTWHAAANLHGLHDLNNVSRLQYYTMQLYKRLEQETGQSCGIFQPGALYLAQTEAREHQLRLQCAKAREFGVAFHEVSRAEAERLHPLVDLDGVRFIAFEADGGNVDPSGVTAAYAAGARQAGAEIHRFCPVTATRAQPDGTWIVETPKGEIHAQWVVNAAGLWAREVGRMAGIALPLQPTEHQYFVTETIPEIAALGRRLPSIADRDGEYYLRQEGQGLLIGAYEKDVRLWAENGTPGDFGHDLFDPDLDRIEENVLRALARVPAAETAGIKRVINGPMIWSPDSAALFGPVPELRNYFCCCGIIPGFSQSGGLGLMSAQWIVEGEPERDMFAWDLARFGDWASEAFTKARVRDQYAHRFKIHFPTEERAAGRPLRQRPLYERHKGQGAVFGLNAGWEHPLWYAPDGVAPEETYGFARPPWMAHVGAEARSLRQGVGVIDISNFAKYELTGPGAADWLDLVLANRVPRRQGRASLAPLLGRRGGIAGDFTVTMLAKDRYLLVGSGLAERYHTRFFASVPLPQGTRFESRTKALAGVNVAGPRARDLLARLTQADLSTEAFPFLTAAEIAVACVPAIAIRVSFTGDLGWELHVAEAHQTRLWDALFEAGANLGLRPVGSRALLSLRLEKGYGSWGREYSPEIWPHEAGLERLVKDAKPAFLGRDAWLAVKDKPPRERLVMLALAPGAADAWGGEPVFAGDTPVGRVSSGGYGFWVETSLALAYIRPDHATPGTALDVALMGRPHPATVLPAPPFDPEGTRLRA